MTKFSPETIRFRLWQLRLSEPDIMQKDAAAKIGCTVDALRAAVNEPWARKGRYFPRRPEEIACDTFASRPTYYLGFAAVRDTTQVINGSRF